MSLPAVAYASGVVMPATTTPIRGNSQVKVGTQVFTVKTMTAAEEAALAKKIDAMVIAEENLVNARAQIADARENITKARADREAASARIAAGQVEVAAGTALINQARANKEDARVRAEAAQAKMDTAKTKIDASRAKMVQQLEAIKGAVRQFYQLKPGDTAASAKIDALIQRISTTQTNLPVDPAAAQKEFTDLRTATMELGKSLKG